MTAAAVSEQVKAAMDTYATHHAPPSTSSAAEEAPPTMKRKNVLWKTVEQQNSIKETPVWEADTVRLPIEYFRYFFDEQFLDNIAEQSNLYCKQQDPNHTHKLDGLHWSSLLVLWYT